MAIMKYKQAHASGNHDTAVSTGNVSPFGQFLRTVVIDVVKQIPSMAAAVLNPHLLVT